jgi:lipid A 3-O-deacylase
LLILGFKASKTQQKKLKISQMLKQVRLLFFILNLLSINLLAQKKVQNLASEIGFKNDNDVYLFVGQDRYYTNGLQIFYRQLLNPQNEKNKTVLTLEIGQSIYNPQSAYIRNVNRIDRPFAGWLYAGAHLQRMLHPNHWLKIGGQGGTLGPDSKAEEVQKWYHHTFGFDKPVGWQYQVPNARGYLIRAQSMHNLHSSQKILLTSSLSMGNVFTNAAVSLLFRWGKVAHLRESVLADNRLFGRGQAPPLELFFFLQPSLHFTFLDATMQAGGDFGFSREPRRLGFGTSLGLMRAGKRWSFQFSYFFRTIENQWVKWTSYGTLGLSFRF